MAKRKSAAKSAKPDSTARIASILAQLIDVIPGAHPGIRTQVMELVADYPLPESSQDETEDDGMAGQ